MVNFLYQWHHARRPRMQRLTVATCSYAIHIPKAKNLISKGNQKTHCAIAAHSKDDRAIFARGGNRSAHGTFEKGKKEFGQS